MRISSSIKNKKIIVLLIIPFFLIAQYYLFKIGIFRPMVKGVEIEITDGDYIKDIDKYIIKLDDTVELSAGKYIKVPSYAKEPNIWFNVLDNNGTIKIEGNKMTALKVGSSSIGIMKNSRVLKKAEIRVVKPKVNSLDMHIEGNLAYVGDKAKVDSVIDVNYNGFKKAYKPKFSSSDDNVLKVEKNRVEAVGVGEAKLIVKCGDKEVEREINIKAYVDEIKISKNILIEVDQQYNINPEIITNPKGLKRPKIIYSFSESKLPIERSISLGKNGDIVGLREGSEKVLITCGNESKTITVNVAKELISNKRIKNLGYDQQISGNKMTIKLSWDYMQGVDNYDIFYKNNLNSSEFQKFGSTKVTEDKLGTDGKVHYSMEIGLNSDKKVDVEIYVVGMVGDIQTKPSKIINITNNTDSNVSIKDVKVESVTISSDENGKVYLKWDRMNFKGSTYSVYVRNNSAGESGFTLYKDGIYDNQYTFSKPDNNGESNTNIDVYIVATHNEVNSKPSNIVNLK